MSAILRAAASAAALFAASAAADTPDRLTPERVYGDPDLQGVTPRAAAVSPDGKLVTFLKARDDDKDTLELWAVGADGGAPTRLVDARAVTPQGKELSEAEKARRERQRIGQKGVVDYHWDEQGRFILVPVNGDLFLFERASGQVRRLTDTPGDEIDSKVSPKGRFVSFVRDQNLYVRDLATNAETALTQGGGGTTSWAVAEFIAQEELGRFTGYWWSPDETRIALTRVDESGVDVIPRSEISAAGATMVEQRYPRAGRPNAKVALFIQRLGEQTRVDVDLGGGDFYVARVDWAKDGKTLYVQRLARDNKTLDLLAVDPDTGAARVLIRQTQRAWVNVGNDFHALKSGEILWTSEESGARHIYVYDANGRQLRQVTRGDWPVASILAVDEDKGLVYFAGSKDTPIERRIYSASYKAASAPVALTPAHGWASASFADNARAFVLTWQDPTTPPQTSLNRSDGSFLRWIEENKLDSTHPWSRYAAAYAAPEFGTLPAGDNQLMYWEMLKPRGFDPAKKYPAIVNVYGGPASQLVRQSFTPFQYRLWQEAGYVVFVLDNRGTPNRNVAFERAYSRKVGVVDVEDQLIGARFLAAQPFVDAKRMGVYGWSNGGFMTLMLLTAENSPFAAGAAGAPPTEWSLYDTAYTERYMGMPQDEKAAYAASDVVPRLSRLKPGSLLLMHGMADDNVLLQNSTRVMDALQAQSIPFELMLYPGQRHGPRGKARQLHVWRTQADFFARKLEPGS